MRHIIITLLVVYSFSCAGQIRDLKFYHLTRDNGLSQSTVNCIVKDSQGYMWFGTRDGLNRYDGYSIKHYKYEADNESSLGLGRVNVLFVDREGRLWIGTDQGGLNLYNPLFDDFTRLNSISNLPGQEINDVRAILQTDSGKLWIATQGHGLVSLDPETKKLNYLIRSTALNINCLEYFGRHLYLGTPDGVFFLPAGRKNTDDMAVTIPVDDLKGLQVLNLFSWKDSVLWVGTYGMGAFEYWPEKREKIEFSTSPAAVMQLNHDIVRDIIDFDDQHIMIGTGGGGISMLNSETMDAQVLQHRLNYPHSLNTNIIYSFYRDDQENLWIGTYNGGVNILFSSKDKFHHIKSYGGENNLSNNAVLAIMEDIEGKLWIGTDGGGLDYYDPVKHEFTKYCYDPGNKNTIGGNVVKSMHQDAKGNLWLGNFYTGLSTYNPKTKNWKRFIHNPDEDNGISSNHIWDITEDSDGNIWLATLGGGLDRYNPDSKNFRHYRNNPDDHESISSNTLSCLLYDSKGSLWVGTEFGGVCRLIDPEKGTFKVYNRSDNYSNLGSDHITTIFEDSRGGIWVGTLGGGLNRFIPEQEKFIVYDESEGLINNLIYGILEDDDGNLWISTNNGLSRFEQGILHPKNPDFRNYTVGDGLQSNEFSPRATCKTSEGMLYFGGINGINYFHPSQIKQNQHIPPIVITDFKIFNESVVAGVEGSPLRRPIASTDEIVLSHKQSVITFEFAALDYTLPSANMYKYQLVGFEDQWNSVGNQRWATYTNLNPGTYEFRVIGSNNDDEWNYSGKTIKLIIRPPLWKTFYFRGAVSIVILLLIFITYRYKVRSLQRHQKKLRQQVDERTRELLNLNELLEKQNREIHFHREELLLQKENLIVTNKELEYNQKMIQEQNVELEQHRNNLEELVKKRTLELEMAKSKAEESDRLKTSFLSNMSHEIRTPLNAIVGFSALLGDADLSANEIEEFMHQIEINSNTLLVLIDDILDLSKIESNQLSLEITTISINNFIDELTKSFQLKKKTFNFHVNNQLYDQHLHVTTDPIRLRQILVNLLDNSFKFTEKGKVELLIMSNSDGVYFHVEDTGIGMSDEVLAKIFDRFYKSENTSEKVYRGTGLGLTITKNLVELLKGKIEVSSQLGTGTSFIIKIPFNFYGA